ncbi:MAG: 3-methyl-2-oxobutanoate hydroxymethyltransferase [Victivallaceae bacterium]|nr:3-methyl-2-oxobutanoate hydroxymethyltransferase [Victivallaceae bacterium]
MNNNTIAPKRLTVTSLRKRKEAGEKIVMLTAYDAITAAIACDAGIDLILVGDSLASTALGYRNTLPLTLEESLHHVKAVRRGAPWSFVVGDMPFMSYQISVEKAIENAGRYLKEADADAVKLEGGAEVLPVTEALVRSGIPVMGHIGLLPQHLLTSGGYRKTGKTEEEAARLIKDALALEKAGCFAIVLECMPDALGAAISGSVSIPVIGIGAGPSCDGQVQVIADIFGFSPRTPKHAKRFAEVGELMRRAATDYAEAVRNGEFPPAQD